ncbi:LTA synthase family protein [Nevskia soli]|uniref:LTA synthase family protein n=1 Tax=Nevskia soli TaxID=418856 RepID=UPI00069242C1|nr:LTA synthase family protein [Nevskia soli]
MFDTINWHSVIAGAVLAFAGWVVLRIACGAGLRWSAAMLLDAALPAACFASLAAATARPVFAGVITLALSGGYAYANRAKLKVLAEPVVFTDVFQAFDIFRHPRLALPFPHKGRVLIGAATVIGIFVLLFHVEPAVWPLSPWPVLLLLSLFFLISWAVGGRFSTRAATALRKLRLSGDPVRDAANFGALGMLLTYGIVARGERAGRQAAALPVVRSTAGHFRQAVAQPVVVVQCESFFDARRMHPAISADLLPVFDRCQRAGIQWGRLQVPCWGANTVRTEFAVLSGMSERAIGLDRFNPYHRFVSVPVTSLAWRLRAEGYRTICLHPFDRTFYGRDQVMPNLGFDEFLGEEAFTGARRVNGYVTDVEVAHKIAEIVQSYGPKVFVFAVTMENHGPWSAPREQPIANLLPDVSLPQADKVALERYLQSLRSADEMLGVLTQILGEKRASGVLAFYGDHLPAFRSAFAAFELHDFRSDYFIWGAGKGSGIRKDIKACQLSDAILEAWRGPVATTVAPRFWQGSKTA